MDDYYEHSTQTEPQYSSYAFIYIPDEIYTTDHITLYILNPYV
jgi:hypothetical protein